MYCVYIVCHRLLSIIRYVCIFGLHADDHDRHGLKGFTAFLLWRAAYWTKQVSLRNKMLIPMYWLKCILFGRDIARF